MGRGRKRKHSPTIPAHIDQSRLPAGIYWDKSGSGRWYVLEPHPEGGKRRAKVVASSDARLSDLHAIMEQRQGKSARGTLGYVIERFQESTEYAALAAKTREDYDYAARVAKKFKTKLGCTLDALQIDRLTTPALQRIVEVIAKGTDTDPPRPSKANHLLRFLRRMFAWGIRHGHCTSNPAEGCKEAKERKQFRMPEHDAYITVRRFAQERGTRKAHTKGSCPPYLWIVMELALLCRLRGIEVIRLTDANATDVGIRVNRVKGSNDNVVRWSPRLRAAWDAACTLRAETLAKHARPVPIRAELRFLFVDKTGTPLKKNALNKAWQSLMNTALEEKAITAEQRFTLHGLKHRGITDTKGNRSDKQQASGHKSAAMLDVYDHDLPVVEPAAVPDVN